MRKHRGRIAVAVVALLLVATVAAAFGILVLKPLPTIDGDERLIGLHERAEVLRDAFGVPHIFAADEHDLFYLQGYVTAQDRLWQMDLYRRAAAGRLAEVLGEPALESMNDKSNYHVFDIVLAVCKEQDGLCMDAPAERYRLARAKSDRRGAASTAYRAATR